VVELLIQEDDDPHRGDARQASKHRLHLGWTSADTRSNVAQGGGEPGFPAGYLRRRQTSAPEPNSNSRSEI